MADTVLKGSKKLTSGLNNVLDLTESNLNNLLDNVYIGASVKVFLVLYAALAAPQLPKNVALVLDSTLMRVVFASLIIFAAINDPVTAILLAVAFIITLQTAAKYRLIDTSENVAAPGGLSWLPSARQGAEGRHNAEGRQSEMNLVQRTVNTVNNASDAVLDSVDYVSGGALNRVDKLATGLVGGVQNVTDSALDSAGYVVDGVTGSVRSVGRGILDGSEKILNTGADTARDLTTGVAGSVRTIGGSVFDGAREVGSGLVQGVNQASTGLIGGVSTLGGCLIDSAEQVGSGLLGGAEHVGQGIIGGARQIGTGVIGGTRQTGKLVLDGADNLAGGVIDATRDISGGMYGGITGLSSSAINATRSMTSGAISGGRTAVGGLLEHMENPPAATEKVQSCPFAPYMSQEEINSMGVNELQGVDQGNCVMTFNNQHCIQGFQNEGVQGY